MEFTSPKSGNGNIYTQTNQFKIPVMNEQNKNYLSDLFLYLHFDGTYHTRIIYFLSRLCLLQFLVIYLNQWGKCWVRVLKQTNAMTTSSGKKCRSPTKYSNNREAGHASCERLSWKVTLELQISNHLSI